MAPYETLYKRPCQSMICWTEMGESSSTGLDLIRDTSEKVGLIRKHLFTTQNRKKSYASRRHQPLEFEVGDHVFLKVMPKRGVVRFEKRGIQFHIGWRYHRVYHVSMRCSKSPCSESILQIQLM